MKYLFYILLFIFLVSSIVSADSNRSEAIISVINEEINEVSRLSKTKKNSDPELLLRLAELYLEKARHLKEAENDKYLELSPEQRSRVNKDKFFDHSQKYFVQAQKIGIAIAKKFPKFKGLSEVYLILALNAKEYGKFKDAKALLKKSVAMGGKGNVLTKAELALAEMEFNDGKFKEAAVLYQKSLPKIKDEKWWTKDAYNHSWCLFRLKKVDDAIDLMKEVHSKSASAKYVDMRSRAEKDIAQFYAATGRPGDGIEFYESLGKDMSKELIALGKFQAEKGQKSNATATLNAAKKTAKEPEDQVEIRLTLLTISDQYLDYNNHLKNAEDLSSLRSSGHMTKEQEEVYLYQLKKAAATIQKSVVEKKLSDDERAKRADMAGKYFVLISQIEKKEGPQNVYLKGETYYAAGSFDKAAEAYFESLEAAEKDANNEQINRAIESMLAVLGQKSTSKETQSRYLLPTYVKFLKYNPQAEKSDTIFQKTFGLYVEKDDMQNAEKVFNAYLKQFPDKHDVHEAMVANIMESLRKKNDIASIKVWVDRIKSGEIQVSKKYALTLNQLITNYQFQKVEKAAAKGDKKAALREYYRLYVSDETTSDVKKNAAYNIAILFYEMGQVDKQEEWMAKAIDIMTAPEVSRFSQTFLLMTTELFFRQRLEASANSNASILKKICSLPDKNKDLFFRNTIYMTLAMKNTEKTEDVIAMASKCGIGSAALRDAKLEVLRSYMDEERWSSYETMLNDLSKEKSYAALLIRPAYLLLKTFDKMGKDSDVAELRSLIKVLYQSAKSQKLAIPLEAADVIASLEIPRLETKVKDLYKLTLVFPEDEYNKRLKEKLTKLDELTSLSLEIVGIGSGSGATRAYMLLIESYQRTVQEIRKFSPPGKSAEYIASFQKSMSDLTTPLLNKSIEYLGQARKDIQENKVLSSDNAWFFLTERLPVKTDYFNSNTGVLMGRGGRR